MVVWVMAKSDTTQVREVGAGDTANYSRQHGPASMREYYSVTCFAGLSRRIRMKRLLILAAGALLGLPACAQSAVDDCARARDPIRCEARQDALKTCSEKRGAERRACLEANIPPPDCSKSKNPQDCEAAQKAKEICKGKTGKELKKCLRDEQPRKKPKAKPRPPAAP
jgi:hypothetical protein